MKKYNFIRNITDYISGNRLQFFFVVVSLLLGTVIGSLSALSLEQESYESLNSYLRNFVSAYNIQSISKTDIFKVSLYNNIKVVLLLWISGLWVGFVPIGVLQVGSKGYKLGFTTVLILQIYRGKGLLLAIVSIIPQVLILVPVIIIYTVFNMNFALSLRKIRLKGQSLATHKEMYLRNLLFLVGTLVVLVLCSLIDAFVVPPVLKPICSFLSK